RSVLEALDHWAAATPSKAVFIFLDDQGNSTCTHTFLSLQAASRSVADHLTGPLQLRKGDRALLVYPPSLDFIVAFLGCLAAGIVAVPVYPPDPSKLRQDLVAFAAVAASSGASVALTSSAYSHA
ncbi:hypothetical protein JKP88DRAFT_132460, partial [Tribonema minus]